MQQNKWLFWNLKNLVIFHMAHNPVIPTMGPQRGESMDYRRYMTGTMPAFQFAIFMKAGFDISKSVRGGLHQPPALESLDQLGGQRLVAVTVVNGDPL